MQSKKVAKIFLKLVSQATYDNVKHYLKSLKPFLLIDDQFKQNRLEWVFGFPQILTRKEYMDNRTKFGVELVSKIHDDAYTYISPIARGVSDDALLT